MGAASRARVRAAWGLRHEHLECFAWMRVSLNHNRVVDVPSLQVHLCNPATNPLTPLQRPLRQLPWLCLTASPPRGVFLALARNSPATGRGIDRLPARLPAVHGSLIIAPSRTAKMVKANAAPPPPPPTGPGIYSATYSGVSMSSLSDRESRIATGTIHLGCWITMGGRAPAPPRRCARELALQTTGC